MNAGKAKWTPKSPKAKVASLFIKLAGDKLERCEEIATMLVAAGYQQERAWADALAVMKCVKNTPIDG